MFKKTNSNNFLIFFLAISCFGIALYFHQRTIQPVINVSKQDSATNINSSFLRFFSMGNKRVISNILWIQTLMESDADHYRLRDKNNWMYLRFNTIHDLDPLFYENYLYGGLFLSIVKDDVDSAADIYEKGLKFYPNDYQLNYNAGFNYYFEMGDFKKGLEKFEKIEAHPEAPAGLKFIINKLRFETGKDYDATLAFIYYTMMNTKDEILLNKLKSDFYSLKAERDLTCLNEGKAKCDMKDAEGSYYIKSGQTWKAQKKFMPYKIHLKKK